MKIIVLCVLLSTTVGVLSNLAHNVRQPKEIAQRRQYVSYANSIIHENPNYPDQAAQSTVKVSFNPNQEQKIIYNPYPNQQPSYPTPQSQLFNVGYSVSFTNAQPKQQPAPKYPRSSLDDGEIITGTRKQNEEVQVPNMNMTPQDFVSSALQDSKKQLISPKIKYSNYASSKSLLTQANLSPTTQKYYKVLEQAKPQVQNTQDLQQRYSWRNLSPGVEIIRSTEVPVSPKLTRPEFDHVRALGRSQDFDYTNAVDNGQQAQHQQPVFYNKPLSNLPPITRVPQQAPKFPIDTSLLRDPVPIQIDTRLIEEAMKSHQIGVYPTKYSQIQEPQQQQDNYLQGYRTLPQNNVVYKPQQDYPVEQTPYQFKVYGKPQTLASLDQSQRQPRFLRASFRPPPYLTFQRRIHVG